MYIHSNTRRNRIAQIKKKYGAIKQIPTHPAVSRCTEPHLRYGYLSYCCDWNTNQNRNCGLYLRRWQAWSFVRKVSDDWWNIIKRRTRTNGQTWRGGRKNNNLNMFSFKSNRRWRKHVGCQDVKHMQPKDHKQKSTLFLNTKAQKLAQYVLQRNHETRTR